MRLPLQKLLGEWVDLVSWDPETSTFHAVSKPGGYPL